MSRAYPIDTQKKVRMKHGCTATRDGSGTAQAIRLEAPPVNSVPLSDSAALVRLRGMTSKKRLLQVGQTTVLVNPSAIPSGFAVLVDGQLAALSDDEGQALRRGLHIALAKEADRAIGAIEGGTLHGDGETPRDPDCALAFDVGGTAVAIVPTATGWDAHVEAVYHCADREAAIVAGVAAAIRREIAIVFEGCSP